MSINLSVIFSCCPSLKFLLALTGALFCSLPAFGQTLIDVDFDNRGASTYTESQVEEDFGELRFTNGVDEGWVQVVTGNQAFGGTGSSIRVRFPEGGEGPGEGGAQWIVELDEGYEEAYLSYRVKFEEGFDFVRGGKLPGLAGGSAPSGSAPADGVRGWSGRLMWRTDFRGVTGQPEQLRSGMISYAKHVHSGFAMDGRQEDEVFWFEADGSRTEVRSDQWYAIRQRVVLNTPGQRDGILQLWIDGRLVLDQDNIQYRNTPDLKIDRLFFSTFFGGGDAWRSSKDEYVLFDDFKMTIPQQRLVPENYSSPEAAVEAANPGDTVLLGSANWYANLDIDEPITVRGRGNARLMAARGNLPIFRIASDGVNIESLRISRGVAGVEAGSQASRLVIANCEFRDCFGDAIRATGSRDVSIVNTDIFSNAGRGVFLDQVNGFFIGNTSVRENGGAGFELFSDNGFVIDSESINNRFSGFFVIGSNSGYVNNVADDNDSMGFLFVDSRNIGFMGNTADRSSIFGLLGFSVNDCSFSQNLIQRSGGVGAILDNSNRNSFRSNTINNSSGIGDFYSSSTQGNLSADNQYQGNAFSLGLIDEGNNTIIE